MAREMKFVNDWHRLEPPFRAFRWTAGKLTLIYESYPSNLLQRAVPDKPSPPTWYTKLGHDPILDLAYGLVPRLPKLAEFLPRQIPDSIMPMALFLECLVFVPVVSSVKQSGQSLNATISDIECHLECHDTAITTEVMNAHKTVALKRTLLFQESQALLLAKRQPIHTYHFVLIEWVDGRDKPLSEQLKNQTRARRVGIVDLSFHKPEVEGNCEKDLGYRMRKVFSVESLHYASVVLE
jgi:hypothetical protein